MAQLALARQYRPHDFTSVIGQTPVVKALQNSLARQQLHHAYLFSGTRGVGKTTIARILAKCFNCETGITPTPCNVCATCQAIDQGRFIDLLEVDAASRTKVEDTRELLDNVPFVPTQGRFKIYLIDEVHMLSNHSFNALLKTLEEPPHYVKFLLATTDPQKLPATILSRCLQFHLQPMSPTQISQRLAQVINQENIRAEDSALDLLAREAQGSLRDALSLLDQAIAYGDGSVTAIGVAEMLGTLPHTAFDALLHALVNKEAHTLINLCAQWAQLGCHFEQALNHLLSCFQQMAVLQAVPEAQQQLEWGDLASLYGSKFSAQDIQLYYQILLTSKRDFAYAPSARAGFEMALLRLLAFQLDKPALQSSTQISSATKNTNQAHAVNAPNSATSVTAAPTGGKNLPASQSSSTAFCKGNEETPPVLDSSKGDCDWPGLLSQLSLRGAPLMLAQHCVLVRFEQSHLVLNIHRKHAPLNNASAQALLKEALQQHFKHPIQLTIQLEMQESAKTPAQLQQQKKNDDLQQLEDTFKNNAGVQELLKNFDGEVQKNSLLKIEK